MLYLLVGMETTGNLLSTSIYSSACNQKIQKQLHEEIKSIFLKTNQSRTIDYDRLNFAQYLDALMCELLRYVAPVGTIDRVASPDYRTKKLKITISKGMVIYLAYDAIMKDSVHWLEPDLFKPE